jgi:cytochrome P450
LYFSVHKIHGFFFLRLPYLEAILMEVQRIHQVVPIAGPRRVTKDTTLNGYNIPKARLKYYLGQVM